MLQGSVGKVLDYFSPPFWMTTRRELVARAMNLMGSKLQKARIFGTFRGKKTNHLSYEKKTYYFPL